MILAAEKDRPVQSRDANRLDWRKASLYQQLDLTLIAEPRQVPAVANWIRTCDQQPAGGDEGTLQIHVCAEQTGGLFLSGFIGWAITPVKICVANRWRHGVEHGSPNRRAILW